MSKSEKFAPFPILIISILTIYQLARLVAFVNVYGGIEHDGGWMLSISRSLAEQGTYTTLVSTIADPTAPAGINVDQKFDIQAPDGRVWFFTGNGIGPASIIPDALVIKLLGTDFWALHVGPLLFYISFLSLAAYLLYQLAGLGAVILFHAFIFCYPHISIFLGYEAMGEVPGMAYILWAYLAFAAAMQRHSVMTGQWAFLGAGVVMGLALNAKLITLWSISGILVWAGLLWWWGLVKMRRKKEGVQKFGQRSEGDQSSALAETSEVYPRLCLGALVSLGGGLLLPTALWELVHLIVLTRLTNFELYLRHAKQRLTFILDDGSGVGLRIHAGPEFFWDKFFVLAEVAHPQRWVTALLFGAIFLGGISLIWLWRNQPYRQNLLAPLWLGWLANTAWFVGLAKTGWPRHFWFGLVSAMLLLCVITLAWLQRGITTYHNKSDKGKLVSSPRRLVKLPPLVAGIVLLILIGWSFVNQVYVWGIFLPDEIVPYWQEKQITNKYDASLPWIIIPRAAQAEVVDYIMQLPPEAHIYYPGQHKSAEITPQTGRLHYPLNRRRYLEPHPADIALIGPSVISPWKNPVQRQDLLRLVNQECPRPAVKNEFYMICPIEANLAQR
jgi:hypothetical protein